MQKSDMAKNFAKQQGVKMELEMVRGTREVAVRLLTNYGTVTGYALFYTDNFACRSYSASHGYLGITGGQIRRMQAVARAFAEGQVL